MLSCSSRPAESAGRRDLPLLHPLIRRRQFRPGSHDPGPHDPGCPPLAAAGPAPAARGARRSPVRDGTGHPVSRVHRAHGLDGRIRRAQHESVSARPKHQLVRRVLRRVDPLPGRGLERATSAPTVRARVSRRATRPDAEDASCAASRVPANLRLDFWRIACPIRPLRPVRDRFVRVPTARRESVATGVGLNYLASGPRCRSLPPPVWLAEVGV